MKITDEAVEVAAKLIYRTSGRRRVQSYESAAKECRSEALEILEAAAPHMLAEAWEEGRNADDFSVSIGFEKNPYRPTP